MLKFCPPGTVGAIIDGRIAKSAEHVEGKLVSIFSPVPTGLAGGNELKPDAAPSRAGNFEIQAGITA